MIMRFGSMLLLFSLFIFPASPISAQSAASSNADSKGIITGKILIKGGSPLAGGSVWFYDALTGPPPFKNQMMRPPFLRIEINADGTFRAELVSGKYYLRAVKRMSPEKAGLQDGDYVYYGLDNKGEAKEYVVKSGEILDIGTISDVVLYKKSSDVIRTAIEGVITDAEGKPVEGVVVFAFRDYTDKPLYFSRRTGPDGKYKLSVSEGTYYLRARNRLKGGRPDPGELFGMYGGETPAPVTAKDGEITRAVDITVATFPGRGPNSPIGPIPGLQPQKQ